MDAPDEPRQRVVGLRHDNQVDVIRHPAPAEQIGLARTQMQSQEVLVAAPVFVGQEDILAIVAAVGDVMRHAGRHHPRWAGHAVRFVSILSCLQMLWAPSPSAPTPVRENGSDLLRLRVVLRLTIRFV
jgi:hypothetical protein